MQSIGIIPARYASTRFPGKPLADIDGVSMIRRVYERATSCASLNEVVVATDDARIYDHVAAFGKVVMTDSNQPSGTDRCLEALQIMNKDGKYTVHDVVVNIQGDEPFIDPEQITRVINLLSDINKEIATLKKAIQNVQDVNNPNVVKVVCNRHGQALYFSRSPIPYNRKADKQPVEAAGHFKHLGIYPYRIDVLQKIVALPTSGLEEIESLEQLRWLENGYRIHVAETHTESIAIDTPEDLKKIAV